MFGSRPPRRGDKIPAWDLVRFNSSRPFTGWLAGPPIWVPCHHFNATRACRFLVTDGALKCPHPHKQYPPRWRAYVPLWDECGTRSFVIVCQRYEETLAAVPHLAPVWVAKMPARGLPIRVWVKEWTRAQPPVTRGELRPQDIRPFLAQLWNDAELSEHFRANGFGPLPACAAPTEVGTREAALDLGTDETTRSRINSDFARVALTPDGKNGKGHK